MATIGQALTAPEAGWARYDDTNAAITYTGTTSKETNVGNYNASSQYFTTITGTAIQFNFRGTKIRIIAPLSQWNSNVTIDIDGVKETYSQQGTLTYQVLLYEKTGLTNTPHTVKITAGTATYANWGLDAVDIDATGFFGDDPQFVTANKDADLTSGVRTGTLFSGGKLTLLPLDTHNSYGTTDATPTMTAASAPSGTVASSSEQTGKEGWRAFNDAYTQAQGWVTLSGVVTGTLSYDFGTPKTINSYTLQTGTSPTEAPNTWTLEGWNGAAWTILDARENVSFAASEKKTFTMLNSTAFNKYRINITKNNGQASTLGIAQMELIEAVNGFLYTSSGSYETGIIDLSPRLSAIKSLEVNKAYSPLSISTDVTPAMTSNTAPSGTVASSSGTTYPAWRVFDKVISVWETAAGVPQWVSYQFPSTTVISAYALTAGSGTNLNGCPKTWDFQGSNDGTTWVTLDSQTGQVFTAALRKSYVFFNITPYTTYRLYITEIQSGSTTAVIDLEALEMMTVDYGGQSLTISTSTSTDLQTWSPYTLLNSDNTIASPLGRYIKVKVDVTGGSGNNRNLVTFGVADAAKFQSNNFVAFDGTLHLATTVPLTVTQDTSFGDPFAKLYRVPLNLGDFKNIQSIVKS